METFAQRYEAVLEQIHRAAERANRSADEIYLIGVSKFHPAEAIQEAAQCGLHKVGESRVQEAEQKRQTLADLPIEWHMVGRLQTNKVKKALPVFDLIHSVDTPKLLQSIDKESQKQGITANVLLQVNIGGEESKRGVAVEAFEALLRCYQQCSNVQCHGLMTLPPYEDDPEAVRPYFRQLRELAEQYRSELVGPGNPCCLSMGMSHDFPVAIEEGATYIRVGTSLFGQRPY